MLDWPKIDVSFMHFVAAFCKSTCLFLDSRSDAGIFNYIKFSIFSKVNILKVMLLTKNKKKHNDSTISKVKTQ